MALKNNFYQEIFEKETKWTELAKTNLLNIYYLNGPNGIKEFYIQKRERLQEEYQINQNQLLKIFIDKMNQILLEINLLTDKYKIGENIEFISLTNLFISNQMNNNVIENKKTTKIL